MSKPVRTQVLYRTSQLERYLPAWRALWESDEHATPFQHPAWLLPWWRQFGQPDLRVLVLYRGQEPIGLLPLYIYGEPGTAERKLLPLGAGTTDYLDGVFHPECTVADIRCALEVLAEDSGWDVMDFLQLRPGSRLAEALGAMPEVQPLRAAPCWRMPALALSELAAKLRRHVMYYRNRAARLGTLSLEFANATTFPAMFDELVRLHTERWHLAGKPGVLADPRVLAWHREALAGLEAERLLRLCALRCDGKALAVAYSLADPVSRADRTEYVYITAYSPEHADLRPGTVLLALAMEQVAREGIGTIDMLRGDEDYKSLWHANSTATLGYRLLNPALNAAEAA